MTKYQVDGSCVIKIAPWIHKFERLNGIKAPAPIYDGYTDIESQADCARDPLNLEEVELFKNYFLNTGHKNKRLRNYAYFILAINTARRCSDLVSIKIGDVINEDGYFKNEIIIAHEQKTKKEAILPIEQKTMLVLKKYLQTLAPYKRSDYLFPSDDKPGEHIQVDSIYRIITRAAKKLGISSYKNIGTHSLRKTLPCYMIEHSNNTGSAQQTIAYISKWLGHCDVSVTFRYLGINQKNLHQFIRKYAIE